MHGLSTHGLSAVTPTTPGAHAIHTMEPDTSPVALTVGSPDHGGAEMSGVGLCFAVLMASLLSLLLRHRRSRGARLWFAATTPRPVAVRRARSPDPPCLFALSIQRC